MPAWNCDRCGQPNGPAFDRCWNCGTGADGAAPRPEFRRSDVPLAAARPRELPCLRCRQPMRELGHLRLHEGSQAAPFLLGAIGELMVKRQGFDAIACTACGKVEFFLPDASADK